MVADRADPSALRWLIGNELRQSRLRAGRTQGEAGKVLGCSHSKINYLETGRNQQQPEEVTTLLRFYDADVAHMNRLASLAGAADRGSWWAPFSDVVPDWLKTFVGLEGLATAEFMYEPLALPGLLQTREYAAALLVGHLRVSTLDSERVVNLRMARQSRLLDERPLRFTTVIEESVLHRVVGGPEVMRQQLRHLLDLAERDNTALHVMPFSVAVHDGLDGEFTILDFETARPVGYVEIPDGAFYVQDHDQVQGYTRAAQRLCEAALNEHESAKVIARRITDLT